MRRTSPWLVFGLPAAICALWTLHAGKDVNWDLLNYHYYLPYELLGSRVRQDFFAIQQRDGASAERGIDCENLHNRPLIANSNPDCHGPQMRAIQMMSALHFQGKRQPNWMAHTPVGHDKLWI